MNQPKNMISSYDMATTTTILYPFHLATRVIVIPPSFRETRGHDAPCVLFLAFYDLWNRNKMQCISWSRDL